MSSRPRRLVPSVPTVVAALLGVPGPSEAQGVLPEPPPQRPTTATTSGGSLGEDDLRALLRPADGGLTEAEVAQRAARVRPAVERREAAEREARAAEARARAGFLPGLDLSADYTRLSDVDLPGFGGEGDGPAGENPFPVILNRYQVLATVQVPVSDYFLEIWPRYEGQADLTEAARFRVETERQRAALAARRTLLELARARGQLEVAKASVELLEQNRQDQARRVAAGVDPRADLLEIEAQLEEVRVQALTAERSVRRSEVALRTLLELELDAPVPLGVPLFEPPLDPIEPLPALLAEAEERRPEVRALRATVAANEDLERAELGRVFPELSVRGRVNHQRPNNRIIPQQRRFDTTWQVSATLAWSPNDLVVGSHRADEAEARTDQTRQDYDALIDRLANDGVDARTAHVRARRALSAARRRLTAAREAYRVRSRQLSVGETTPRNLLDAETAVRDAQLQLVDALVELRLARAQLDHLLGRAEQPTS